MLKYRRLLFGVPEPNIPKYKLDGQPDDGILSALLIRPVVPSN
jgi:hypothetical protein